MSRTFDATVANVTANLGWVRLHTATEIIRAWDTFVTQCERGYDMNIYEYENDLSVRTLIGQLLSDPAVASFEEANGFEELVHQVDLRFKAILNPDTPIGDPSESWWQKGVLASAGPELVQDYAAQGITMTLSSD